MPNYSGHIPTNQELGLIMGNLYIDPSLKKWALGYSEPVENNEVECIGTV